MAAPSHTDPYLERLAAIQAETAGIDARLDALEAGYALDAEKADAIVRSRIAERPVKYEDFLSEAELKEIALRHEQMLNKGVDCDALDYALAAACGVVSGLLDVVLVGSPGGGVADAASDKAFDAAVIRFARSAKDESGKPVWNPKPGNEENLASAIGALERHFGVGYDQQHSTRIDSAVKHLSTENHHALSASHYPDPFGLLASICDQFTDASTFFSRDDRGIAIVESTGKGAELTGTTFTQKVFCGFVNWLGHCMSDVAGSSTTRGKGGRGQGLPIPFTEFFMLCDFGKLEKEKGQWQSFATVMTRVYEQGYDLRHGAAATFPVVISDLLVRAVYTLKRHFHAGVPWSEALPDADSPEMQRMSTVGIGSMCLVDMGLAAVTSWGSWVKFFGELNLAAWARLGLQGAHELQMVAEREQRNLVEASGEISQEWNRLLERSRDLLEG